MDQPTAEKALRELDVLVGEQLLQHADKGHRGREFVLAAAGEELFEKLDLRGMDWRAPHFAGRHAAASS